MTEKNKAGQVEEDLRIKIKTLETKEVNYNDQLARIRTEKTATDEKNKQLEKELQKLKGEDQKATFELEFRKKLAVKDQELDKEKAEHANDIAELNKKLNQKKACCTIF